MLITRFHQMIRNRIVWAIIATGVSLAFLFSFTSVPGCSRRGDSKGTSNAAGTLYGEDVEPTEFRMAMFYELGLGSDRGLSTAAYAQLRHQTWHRLAVLKTAERMGIQTPDDEIAQILARERGFQSNGVFDKQRYSAFVQSRGVDIPSFEAYIRQNMTIQKLLNTVESTVWAAPSDLDRRLRNLTDVRSLEYLEITPQNYTGVVSVSKADALAFYERNRDAFTIPERVQVKYVTFPYASHVPTNVNEEDVQDYYDRHTEEFTLPSTNLVATPEPLEKVRPVIEASLLAEGSRFAARDAATAFAMELAPDRGGHKADFEALAARHHLGVSTTALFTINEALPLLEVDQEFNRTAFNLIQDDPELSFSDAVAGSNAVYVLAAEQRLESRVPAFDEIAATVTPEAERAARQEAFLAWSQELHEKLTKAVSTNHPFASVAGAMGYQVATTGPFTVFESLNTNLFDNARILVPNIAELDRGELSGVIPAATNAYIAFMADRLPGNPNMVQGLRPQMQNTLQEYHGGLAFREYGDYLLKAANFEDFQPVSTNDVSTDDEPDTTTPQN